MSRGRWYPPDTPCQHCGYVPPPGRANRLRLGRCKACYMVWWRSGGTRERVVTLACRECGGPHWAKGYCRSHHYYLTPGVRERATARSRAYSQRRRAAGRAS